MLTLKENKICESAVNNFIKSQQTTDSLIQIKKNNRKFANYVNSKRK